MTPEVLNFLLQAGLPAGLGVLVVYYLLQHHLPREQAMYSESLRAQQSVLRDTFVDEHNRTRVALDRLSEQTSKLSEAVFTLRGQEGQGGN